METLDGRARWENSSLILVSFWIWFTKILKIAHSRCNTSLDVFQSERSLDWRSWREFKIQSCKSKSWSRHIDLVLCSWKWNGEVQKTCEWIVWNRYLLKWRAMVCRCRFLHCKWNLSNYIWSERRRSCHLRTRCGSLGMI